MLAFKAFVAVRTLTSDESIVFQRFVSYCQVNYLDPKENKSVTYGRNTFS